MGCFTPWRAVLGVGADGEDVTPTITPTRFAALRHGVPDPNEHYRWSLASHALSVALRRRCDVDAVLADGDVWLGAAQALWAETRRLENPRDLKAFLDDKLGRAPVLALREQVRTDVRWAVTRVGPGRAVAVGVTASRELPDGTRVFGQLPFLLDDGGVRTLVSLDDGARSLDLARCWAWLVDPLPHCHVTFVRLLDPCTHTVREVLWDDTARAGLESQLLANVPALAV